MRLTPNFKREEFACKCGCGKDTVDIQLMQALHLLRQFFNEPVTVTSGFRCPSHNLVSGGAHKSLHMEGKASDIKVKNFTPQAVYKYLDKEYPNTFGIGLYDSWVHIDVREDKARWGA